MNLTSKLYPRIIVIVESTLQFIFVLFKMHGNYFEKENMFKSMSDTFSTIFCQLSILGPVE